MNVEIEMVEGADTVVRERVLGALSEYNAQQTGSSEHPSLIVALRSAGSEVVGGLVGHTSFGWLHIELLFVPELARRRGIGTELMRRAESEAVQRGCHGAWLDTFEFQARQFYERLGYQCFGELSEYPRGFSRYFMKKALSNAVPSA
jgi:GNAT superfamily N-acetyltransferase